MLSSIVSRARFLAVLLAALLVVGMVGIAPPAAEAAVKKPLDIVKVYYDPPGKDYSKNSYFTKEYIQVKNTGKKTLTLTGYTIRDSGPKKFTFPKGTKLKPGKTLTIRTGKGKNTASTVYWNNKGYVWNNTGDKARTYTNKGKLIESCAYKGGTHKKATKTTVRTTKTTAYC
ncbi:MAG: lamin tail domain-containing protein [Brachybacterium tyrofermentans]